MPRTIRWAACLPVLALPRVARAEVLDKVAPPWEPFVLGCTLVALAVTVALALSGKKTLRAAGFVVALLWAVYRIGTDEWFSEDVGPHIRVDLPAGEARVWLGTIVLEGLVPLVAVLVIGAVTTSRYQRPDRPRSRA
ncbi:hypothetical protein [Polyangium jinanense]|uniref:Uncharacterized protein n=1 Tax=Polyangium jinanense TaxID=2829994 RepID=A0A9X3X1R8_9BACT|nr:hypothetical protein [Polyangium jinanense]MDC3954395.1 hypothetical protein [Polyangium jinanense]MDC3980698.1 hypothetical protein [Polyangium jinanense]